MNNTAKPRQSWLRDFCKGDMHGVHFAVRVFFSTTILWMLLRLWGETNPIWAISSMIAVSDPQVELALKTFRGRILNAFLGCAIGMIFLVVGGAHEWLLPFALAAAVLISSYVVRVQVMWRQAPITTAIVIAAGLSHHSKVSGAEVGLMRVAEVMLGCVVGLLVTWLMSKIWPPAVPDIEPDNQNDKKIGLDPVLSAVQFPNRPSRTDSIGP